MGKGGRHSPALTQGDQALGTCVTLSGKALKSALPNVEPELLCCLRFCGPANRNRSPLKGPPLVILGTKEENGLL